MSVRMLKYYINEGFRGFCINGLMSLASVIIITACLLLFSIYSLFSMNLHYISEQVKAHLEVQVYIDLDVSDIRIKQIESEIKSIENVKNVTFFSKDEALEAFKIELGNDGDDVFSEFENENPLSDSYKVTMLDIELTAHTVTLLEKIADVSSVKNNINTVNGIIDLTKTMKSASFWMMLIFAIISLLIIYNTIKITVFARRKDINIMKFVGATNWFIRWPFIIEGIIIGLVGAIITIILISNGYNWLYSFLQTQLNGIISLYNLDQIILVLIVYISSYGMLIGAIGSGVSVCKHLNV